MPAKSLQDLFIDELKDLYSAENQILKALPRIIRAADSVELKQALQEHADVTQKHVQRLEQIVADLGAKPRGKKCMGMEGVLAEGKEVLQEKLEPHRWRAKSRALRNRWVRHCAHSRPIARSDRGGQSLAADLG